MRAALPHTKKDVIGRLQQDILGWEGFRPPPAGTTEMVGLGPVESVFPNGVFPVGAVHEFVSAAPEHAAATSGFMAGVLGALMRSGGACLWIGISRTLFPPALKFFGVEPDRIIFIDLKKEKDVLWAMEEALKCEGLAAVIGEVSAISFTQSRRLQLAVEQSKVTGFLLSSNPAGLRTTACVARWRITPLPSETEEAMPGIGFARWNVELLKVRNGSTGNWKMEWVGGKFVQVHENMAKKALLPHELKAREVALYRMAAG